MCRDYSSLVVDPTLLETHASHVFIKKHFFFISFSVSVAICKSPPPQKKPPNHPLLENMVQILLLLLHLLGDLE